MAIINIDGDDTTWRGLAELTFTPIGSTQPIDLPKPSAFTFAKNPQVIRIGTTSTDGYEFQGTEQVTGFDPQLTVVYRQMQPELWALKEGQVFETLAEDIPLQMTRTVRATAQELPGAGATGIVGFTIAAQVPSVDPLIPDAAVAVVTRNHEQVKLTLVGVPVDPADMNDDEWAVGAQGALYFAQNLVDTESRVTYTVPYTVTSAKGFKNTNKDIGRFKIDATLITTANEVVFFKIYDARPMSSGAMFASRQEGLEIGFNILPSLQANKLFYDLIYTGEFIA